MLLVLDDDHKGHLSFLLDASAEGKYRVKETVNFDFFIIAQREISQFHIPTAQTWQHWNVMM